MTPTTATIAALFASLCLTSLASDQVTVKTLANGSRVATHEGRTFSLPFDADMQRFARENAKNPNKGGIVFTGSSSFVGWKNVKRDMAPLPVINHAFGGSDSAQLWYYADKAVSPNEPKLIVVYIGDNDMPQAKVRVPNYLKYVRLFIAKVRAELPRVRFVFVSSKPSVARWSLWSKYQEANRGLEELCASTPGCTYVDITPTLLDAQGKVRPECFVEDKLHVKQSVYADWTRIIKPVVERIWGEVQPEKSAAESFHTTP
jgi:hypothetical protein